MGVSCLGSIDTVLLQIAAGRENHILLGFPYYFKSVSVTETLIMPQIVHIVSINILIKMEKERNFIVKYIILLLKFSNV